MNNQAYWSRRFEDLKNEQMKRAELTRAELKRLYEQALQEAHDEVLAWYQRYAKENNLTLREARRQLDARGMRAFKMTLEEFKRLAKQKALSPEYQRLLDNASIRVRLDRSQVLMIKLRDIIEKLAKEQQVRMEEVLKKTYEDSYYKAAYETQKVSRNAPLNEIQEETVRKVLSKPWAADGRDFSARIWGQRDQLVNALQIEITRGLISHKGTGTIAKRIAQRFNTSFSNASRLVETEVAYFQERGMLDSFAALGVEQVRLLAVLDNRTSEICQELDGKVVDLKDAEPGVTTPPFHCYCRTTVVPVSEFDSEESTRAARDPKTGKTVYVPGDLTYKEWKKKYVVPPKSVEVLNPESDEVKDSVLSKDIVEAINDGVAQVREKYDLPHFDIAIKTLSKASKVTAIQYNVRKDGLWGSHEILINNGFNWAGSLDNLNQKIYNNYEEGRLAAKNVQQLVWHEIGHMLSYSDCERYAQFLARNDELQEKYVKGISGYADGSYDGAECIAEAFVRQMNGEPLSKEAEALLLQYIEPRRKKVD